MKTETLIDILGLVGLVSLCAGIYGRFGIDVMLMVAGVIMLAVAFVSARRPRGTRVPE